MSDIPFWEDFIQTEPWPIVRKPYVVAEIGINHNGDVSLAKQMIETAHQCGCQAVKFQKRTPELCVPPHQRDVLRETPWGLITYMDYRYKIEFGREEYDEIDAFCRDLGVDWFASAWDIPSLEFLRTYNSPYNKIPSAMLTNRELVRQVALEGKMTFISTGMSEYEDIDYIVNLFRDNGCPFILLHAVSEYPVANEKLNLRHITALRSRYHCPVGNSGHESTMLPSLLAVMMGAVAIERHFTINRAYWGTDQAASLEPRGLATLMNYIHQVPYILGTGERVITEQEKANAKKLRFFMEKAEQTQGNEA
ncbi:MAG: N-acetylneuraminate synthase family protein [Desulfuromonadales bacterium]